MQQVQMAWRTARRAQRNAAMGGLAVLFLAAARPAVAADTTTYVGLNFGANIHAMTAAESAGAVVAFTNWNNLSGVNGASSALQTSVGGVSGMGVTWSDFEGAYFAQGSAPNGHASMMWGYSDNTFGTAVAAVSNITAHLYDVYVYFGSDGNGRSGTVGIQGDTTYSFLTASGGATYPSGYQRAASTGPGYAAANYAVWSNRTGSAFNVVFTRGSDNSGLHGIQIVARTFDAPTVANAGVTGITSTAAWLNGTLVATGAAPTAVSVYWGTNDVGMSTSGWSGGAVALGTNTAGATSYTVPVTGLARYLRYYYRYYATNAFGESWASATSFLADPPPVTNAIGLKFGADFHTLAPLDVAGVVVAATNWNNIVGTNVAVGGLLDHIGNVSSIGLTTTGFEDTYTDTGRLSASNGDERLVWDYLDNNVNFDGAGTATISGITADDYDVYVYIGSDNPNRRGTVGLVGRETYSYKTINAELSFPGAHIRTTDTANGFPFASYAVWTNLTDSSFSVRIYAWQPDGGASYASGINGIQIVERRSRHLAGAPLVYPTAATAITGSGAQANGVLTSTGTAATAVWLYWGTGDAGAARPAWNGGVVSLGAVGAAVPPDFALSAPLAGLAGETTYVYRFLASNAVEEVWSAPRSFRTAYKPGSYAHSMRIRFHGYTQPETLVNFPALILLSNNVGSSAFDYSQFASANANDLRFLSADQTQVLNHEVEWWNTNGISSVWVQVPSLVDSNDYVWAFWGNPQVAAAPAPFTTSGATWDASVYRGVWHFAETSGAARDSSSYHNDGAVSTGVVRGVAGQIGRAYNFDQDTLASVLMPVSESLNVPTTLSLTSWNFYNRTTYAYCDFIDRRQDNSGDYGYDMENGGQMRFYVATNGLHNEFTGPQIPKQDWFLTTGTYDGSTKLFYHGGTLVDTRLKAGPITAAYRLSVGKAPLSIAPAFPGVIDEVRVCATALSANYVIANHLCTASNATFVLYNEALPIEPSPSGLIMLVQ